MLPKSVSGRRTSCAELNEGCRAKAGLELAGQHRVLTGATTETSPSRRWPGGRSSDGGDGGDGFVH